MRPQRVHNFGTYFVSAQSWGRRSVFQTDRMARLFVETLLHYRSQSKYLLHEFVVMPDHAHLIITPLGITLERAVQFIKGGFSHRAGETGYRMEIWQKGFTDHRIWDGDDYERHRKYIHQNPVKAGFCASAGEYAYSSAAGAVPLDPIPQRLKPES